MECLRSINNQHGGLNLKSSCCNNDWYLLLLYCLSCCPCTAQRQKTAYWWNQAVLKSYIYSVLSGLFWNAITKTCYRFSHAVISWNVDHHWLGSHWDETGVSPTRDTVQSKRRHCGNHSLPWNQEVALTCGWGGRMHRMWDKEGEGERTHCRERNAPLLTTFFS